LARPKFNQREQGFTIMSFTRYLPFAGRLLIGLPFAMKRPSASWVPMRRPRPSSVRLGCRLPPLAYAVAVVVELGGGPAADRRLPGPRRGGLRSPCFSIATAVAFHSNFADQETR